MSDISYFTGAQNFSIGSVTFISNVDGIGNDLKVRHPLLLNLP